MTSWALLQTTYLALACAGLGATLTRAEGQSGAFLVSIGIVAYSTAAMVQFWISYLLLPGNLIPTSLGGLWVAITVFLGVRALLNTGVRASLQTPLLAFIGATLLIVLWVQLFATTSDPIQLAASRWVTNLPGDNRIPLDFALSFSNGQIKSPLHGDWLSSDRPPLQTALFLVSPGYLISGANPTAYQSITIAYQMFVLLAIWSLVRSFGADASIALLAMATVLFTPLTLVNAAFVWPKLLAASFLFVAFALHFAPLAQLGVDARVRAVSVGAAVALAMLSHGGSVFVILAMGLTALLFRSIGSRQYVVTALLVAGLAYVPWLAYQRFADPPGNRLVKWHLAGVVPIDQRSTGRTLSDEYGKLSTAEIVSAKVNNLTTIAKGYDRQFQLAASAVRNFVAARWEQSAASLKTLRNHQFFFVPAGMGLLGVALFLSFFGIAATKTRELTTVALLSFVVWALLMFQPGSTIIHQGSLFPEIALLIGVVVFAAHYSYRLAACLTSFHIISTLIFYLPPAV